MERTLKTAGTNLAMRTSTDSRHSLWIPVLLACLLFLALGGQSILLPSNTGWLMRGFFDPPTNLLGWEFFRETPLLQFPLGANPRYGMEQGSSIVFSDSLPLFALPFKLIGPLLPDSFQYFGLWVLTCMVLQGVFGYLTLSRFVEDRRQLCLGTGLLLLLPPYLMRFSIHLALGGQWLLMAGLYLYFDKAYRARFWLVLLAVATLTHAYLLVMLGAIWGADLLQRLLRREASLARCVVRGLTGCALVLTIMWLLGYFMLGSSPAATGSYGRMNLLSLIDSRGAWSRLLPGLQLPFIEGDGFAYMGVGMLGLLAIACLLASGRRGQWSHTLIWPLIVMSVLLLLVSLTNTVSIGHHTLIQFEIPDWAVRLYQVFRSPGRMFWPVFYLLCVTTIAIVCTRTRPQIALGLLAIALIAQIYDLSNVLAGTRNHFQGHWNNPLTSRLWTELGSRYDKVLYIAPTNVPPDFIPLSNFALHHGMSINAANFARVDTEAQARTQAALAAQVQAGTYDPKALYVFNDLALWDQALQSHGADDAMGELDGIKLLLPGMGQCEGCRDAGFVPKHWGFWPAEHLPTLIGQLRDGRLVAQPGISGYLSYGPYTHIPQGKLRYRITYSASGSPLQPVGNWDVVSNATTQVIILAQGPLMGTEGEPRTLEGIFDVATASSSAEIRTFSNGAGELALISVELLPER